MPIDRGCVFQCAVQFKRRSDGQPIDVTTWQFEATLRDAEGNQALTMSTGGGHFIVFDGPNGWMRIYLSSETTQNLTAGPVSAVLYRTDGERTRIGKLTELVRDPE